MASRYGFRDVRPHWDITVNVYSEVSNDRSWRYMIRVTRSGNCGGSWWRQRLVVVQRNSVFAVFSCNRLERIHAATSSMHADICINSSCDADGRLEPRICVSSAKRCGLKPWLSINDSRSAVYSKKRIGPSTDPCGTPNRYCIYGCYLLELQDPKEIKLITSTVCIT